MTNAQFIAVKGNNTLSSRQFYIPLVQCERIINLKQALGDSEGQTLMVG